MSKQPKPYTVTWTDNPKTIEALNTKLAVQLNHIDEMLQGLYAKAVQAEEGLWTPIDLSGANLTLTNATGRYMRFGSLVITFSNVTFPTTANTSQAKIGGLPFTPSTDHVFGYGGFPFYTDETTVSTAFITTPTAFVVHTTAGGVVTNAALSGNNLRVTLIYRTSE